MVPSQLTLLVPGLFGPFPAGNEMLPAPSLPALLDLLRCASPLQNDDADDPDAWLCARFGISRDSESDWPLAPLLVELELGEAGQDYWLRADPVHLRADRSHLVLFGPEALAIRQEEADALAEGFNALYQPDGLRLYTPTPNRWYLRLAQAPRLANTPLPDVIGRDIDRHLPRGEDAGSWHARLNEIQMLFHTHAVNERRAEQGQPGINSLWLWGGGRMPASLQAQDAWVCSDDPLARALARAASVPLLESDGDLQDWLPTALNEGPGLVVLSGCRQAQQYGDTQEWSERIQELERTWWAPLQAMRAQGRLQRLVLQAPPRAAYHIGAPRWWERLRRPRALRHYLAS
ncbi:MAG: hypothetical protein OQL11_04380 [Gammaproteobacteria bacterium]|nr:hypothetical protein [Gammaproteobacteria bacterium]